MQPNFLSATLTKESVVSAGMKRTVDKKQFGLRVAARRADLGLSQEQLASEVGMTQQGVDAIENGKVARPRLLRELAGRLQASEDWLLYNDGSRPPLKTRPLVDSFSPDDIDPLEQFGDDRPEAAPHPTDFPKDAILEAAPRGGMGAGETALTAFAREVDGVSEVDAIRPDYWRFPQRFLNETLRRPATALLVIECEGDSMQPTLSPGERVWVDTTHKIPSPDGIYAMRDRFDNVVVKRLQLDESGDEPMLLVISDNPSHSTTKRRLGDVHIFGKVVGGFRMF